MAAKIFIALFFIFLSLDSNSQTPIKQVSKPVVISGAETIKPVAGFSLPRYSLVQRNALKNLQPGQIIWCNDCNEAQIFDGIVWRKIDTGKACEYLITEITISGCNGQTWMSRNLDVETYRNGDTIPQVQDPTQWSKLTTGAWCYFGNKPSNGNVYGKLYNWYAVNDPRGLAPAGWKIPSIDDWTNLLTCLGGDNNTAGVKLKETGSEHWETYDVYYNNASNSTNFTALPGGIRHYTGSFGTAYGLGKVGFFWSSNGIPAPVGGSAMARFVGIDVGGSFNISSDTPIGSGGPWHVNSGFSVRCIKQ